MKKVGVVFVLAFVVLKLQGCGDGGSSINEALKGGNSSASSGESDKNVTTGNSCGDMRAFVIPASSTDPALIGASFSGRFLSQIEQLEDHTVWVLPFSAVSEIDVSPFDHLFISWNTHGHEPPMVYDKPHFDFHFHMASSEDRQAYCSADGADMGQCMLLPTPDEVPLGYAPGPNEEGHGVHWIPVNSPEFTGAGFSSTLIYGSYAGDMVFVEPMVTSEFLMTLDNGAVSMPVPQPQTVGHSGWYPMNYSVAYDTASDCYAITLDDLVYREGTTD